MQDNLKFKPRYQESETYQKMQEKIHGEYKHSRHERDLFNYLLQTYPEQAIEIQETDANGNPILIYNEDIILLLALLAKLFGGTREIIEDLQYAYDIDYLTSQEKKSNTDNLLILLANEMQFTFLNDDNQETKIKDIKEKKRFLEQYFISKRFRGTFLAIELILNAFKEYQNNKGFPFEYEDLSEGTVTTIKILTDGEDFIDPNHTVYRTVEEETYLSLNQNHFLYKMITNIKPAGFTYNIILDYLVDAIVVEGERIIADNEDNTFMVPKIKVSIKRTPGDDVETETYNENSVSIEPTHPPELDDYDFEYWKVNGVRYEGAWPITITTDTDIEAIFYKKKDVEVKFYNTGTGEVVSSGTVKASRTTNDQPVYSVSFTMDKLNFYPSSVEEPTGQSFIGWVEDGDEDEQIIATNLTFTKDYDEEPTAPLWFNTVFEITENSVIPPELITSEARVIFPMSEDLNFYLEFKNNNSFPVDLYIETGYAVSGGPSGMRVIENLGKGNTGGTTFRINYTDMSKPATDRFIAWFKPTNSSINSRYTRVNRDWWTMVGDYRAPGTLSVQTRIQDALSITYNTTLPRYAYLSKITVGDHRDWRNPTHRLKLYGDTVSLNKNTTNPSDYTTYLFNNLNSLSANIVLESYETTSNITTTSITNQTVNRNPDIPVRTTPDLKPEYYITGHDSYTQTRWVNVRLEARRIGALTPFVEDVLYLTIIKGDYYGTPWLVDYGIIPKGTTSTLAHIQTNKIAPPSGELKMDTLTISIGHPTELRMNDIVTELDLDGETGPG